MPEAFERLGQRLSRDTVEGQRQRIDSRRDEIGACLDRSQRSGKAHTRSALDVEADRKLARVVNSADELLGPVGHERTRRIVDDHARRSEIRQLPRLLDQSVGLAGSARAVHEPGVEGAARAGDRRSRLSQVRDVVQRIVEAKDLDPVLGGADDEPTDDVRAHGARADEETAPERDAERCRDASLDPADSLPRAFHPPTHGRVEDAAARDLEAREPRLVEDLCDAQHLGRRQAPGERLLREEPDRRVDQLRHGPGP
jgi:hypothetical protein